jgi:hypothetical protein
VGELPAEKTLHTAPRSKATALAISVVLVLTGAAAAFFVLRAPGREPAVATNPGRGTGGASAASVPAPPASAPAKQPRSSSEQRPAVAPSTHEITVDADAPKAVCRVRIDGGPTQTQFVPCRFQVAAKARFNLVVVKHGFKAFEQQWTVAEDRALALEVREADKHIVLAGTEPAEMKPRAGKGAPAVARRSAQPRPGPSKPRPEAAATPPKVDPPATAGTAPTAKSPATAAEPESKPPAAKPKPKRHRVGEGVLDF